jgi:regulator of protease activity HflC (stomatin/prohibitin superfamily)
VENPEEYVTRAEATAEAAETRAEATAEAAETRAATTSVPDALPEIDQGMRLWYESCACCLSEAYPEIKARLDAEHAAATAAAKETAATAS